MFQVGERLIGGEELVPHVAAHTIELLVVGEVIKVLVGYEPSLFLGEALGDLFLEALVLGHELGVAAEQDVGTAAGHVGGNGDGVLTAGLGDDAGFAFVIFGVEDLVADAHLLEDGGEAFALLDRDGADEHGLTLGVALLDFVGGVAELLHLGAVHHVGVFLAPHDFVGGDTDYSELVDFVEFGGLGFGGTSHAGQFLVHAEVVLESDGGEGLVLALDLDAFLGFDGLVQAIAPAATGHEASGEFIDDNDLGAFVAIADDVFAVALIEHVGAQGLLHVMGPARLVVSNVVEVSETKQLLDLEHTLFGESGGLVLLIDGVVAGGVLFARFLALDDLAADELGNDAVDLVILVGGFLAGAGNDEGGAGFVDEDGVDFVDDGVFVHALGAVLDAELHVVAEVVEAELVIGAVGDVGVVGVLALLVVEVVDDDTDREAEELVELAHPLRVAAGEVVVDGH